MPGRKRRRKDSSHAPPSGADQRVCWLCLEPRSRATRSGARELVRCGCACRGSGAGWAHLACLVRAAQHNADTWSTCPTCKTVYSGRMLLNLARERARLAEIAFDAAPTWDVVINATGRVSLGRDHAVEEELSSSMNMLATTLIGRAQYAEACKILENLVARDTERWGVDDEVTLGSKTSLVQALIDMGDFAVAHSMSEQLVAKCVEQLGRTHTTTLHAQLMLAQVLGYLGKEAQARKLWEELISTWDARSGMHDETICAKHMYANSLHSFGDAAAARALYEEVFASYRQQLGPEHEDTLNAEGTLAELQIALGNALDAAEQTLSRCVLLNLMPSGSPHCFQSS